MRSNKAIMEAITMSRKMNTKNQDIQDFKLPPANRASASNKNIKVKRGKSGSESTLGSKSSTRAAGQYIVNNNFGKKPSNDYDIGSVEGVVPLKQMKPSQVEDNLENMNLTEEQELSMLKTRILEQRKELENGRENITALQRNFEALSMFCKKERGENQSLKNMNEKLKNENLKFIEKITGMDAKIKALSTDNELLAKDKVRCKKLVEEMHEMKMNIKVLEKQVDTHKNNYRRSTEMNEKLKNDISSVRQDYKSECEKVKSLTIKLQDQQEAAKQADLAHKSEIFELEQKYKRIMEDLKDSLAKVKGNSAKEQDNLIDELQACRAEVKDLKYQLSTLEKAMGTKDILLKDQTQKNEELAKQVDTLRNNISSGSASFEQEKEELLKKIHDLNMSKDVLKAQYSELSNRLKQLTDEGLNKDQLTSKNLESQQQTISALHLKIAELEEAKNSLTSQIEQMDQNIISLKCDHEGQISNLKGEHEKAISAKESEIETLRMEIRQMGQKLASSDKDNNGHQRELTQKDNEIMKLKKEIEGLTDRVRVIHEEISQKEAELAQKDKQLEEKDVLHASKLAQAEKKYEVYEKEISELKEQIEAEKTKFNELAKGQDVVKQLQYEITMLKKSHEEEQQKLKETIEKEVRSKMSLENKHKSEVKSFEAQLNILNKDIKAKLEEMDKLRREIKSNRSVTDLFKADIERQKEEIQNLTKENEEMKQKIEQMEQEIEKYKERLGNVPDIDYKEIELKEKIAKMKEAKIRKLLTKIDNVMNSLETNMCCYLCMEVFNDAITLTPCGHNFCSGCFKEHKPDKCPKCDSAIDSTIPDIVMKDVVAKYLFQRDILAAFKNEDVWKQLANNASE